MLIIKLASSVYFRHDDIRLLYTYANKQRRKTAAQPHMLISAFVFRCPNCRNLPGGTPEDRFSRDEAQITLDALFYSETPRLTLGSQSGPWDGASSSRDQERRSSFSWDFLYNVLGQNETVSYIVKKHFKTSYG